MVDVLATIVLECRFGGDGGGVFDFAFRLSTFLADDSVPDDKWSEYAFPDEGMWIAPR